MKTLVYVALKHFRQNNIHVTTHGLYDYISWHFSIMLPFDLINDVLKHEGKQA